MYTLGSETPEAIAPYEELHIIAYGFVCTAIVGKTAIVKLNSDGTVSPITAVGDKAFGMVTTGNTEANTKVVVLTPFMAIVRGLATATVATGAFVSAASWDTTDKLTKYTTTAAGGWATGLVLSGATLPASDAIVVGILRTPHAMPV